MQQSQSEGQQRNTGRWSKEEHQKFMYAIMQFGKDWKKVEQYVQTRSGSQVRSHAQKFFNKMQKSSQQKQDKQNPRRLDVSDTEFNHEVELGNEATPCTPMQLITLIKKQSNQQGGRVNLGVFKQKLQEQTQKIQNSQMPEGLARQKSYKSMNNILSAYEEVNENDRQVIEEDASFLIQLTKKYKKFFAAEDFDKLIDYHPVKNTITKIEKTQRKRSFTLPEGSDLEGHQLQEKIEQIKKQIRKEKDENIQLGSKQELQAKKNEQSQKNTKDQQKNKQKKEVDLGAKQKKSNLK